MLGGRDSAPHRYRLLSEGRPPRELHTKEVGIEIRPGDCLEVRSAGGGGWGPPEKRSSAARGRDRLQGLVTSDAAKADKAFSSEVGTGSREENASRRTSRC